MDETFQNRLVPPYLFSLYAEYIWRETALEENNHGLKIGERNISNLCYADNVILIAENTTELSANFGDESQEPQWRKKNGIAIKNKTKL